MTAPPRHVPAGIRSASGYLPELESLRGIAILLVFLFHASGVVVRPGIDSNPLMGFVRAGHSGVTLFFVLSAFLLSRPFLAAARDGRPARWKHFWARRALRILPLYATAVLFGAAMLAERPADLLNALPHLFFLDVWPGFAKDLKPYSDVWWSLGTELQFYLLLPFVALCFTSRAGRRLGILLLGLYWLGYLAYARGALTPGALDQQLMLGLSLLGRAPAFAFGILAAWVYDRHGTAIRDWCESSIWVRAGAGDLLLVGLLFAQGELLARIAKIGFFDAELQWHEWHVIESALWTAAVLLIVLVPLRSKRLFSNRILGWLGILSYSIYLIHVPVLYRVLIPFTNRLRDGPQGFTPEALLATLIAALLVIGLSLLSYRFIEQPFLKRKVRID